MSKMKIFKSNRSFYNFNPTLPKTLFTLKISKRAPFKYPDWESSSQMDCSAFVKIITRKLKQPPKYVTRNS